MNFVWIVSAVLVYLIFFGVKIKKDLHMLQLNSYQNIRYFTWLSKNRKQIVMVRDLIPAFSLIFLGAGNFWMWALVWIGCYGLLTLGAVRKKTVEKKKLVITSRVKRLIVTTGIIWVALLGALYSMQIFNNLTQMLLAAVGLVIVGAFSYLIVLCSNMINRPIEKLIANWYVNDAKSTLKRMSGLKVIGITGSFGKTSTKYFLNHILSERFNVLMTPESYNTTMGVVKTIRTMLKPIHEIFIVEMGAKQKGDIKEICDLVSPQYGILTSIGEQHLETFKNIDNIIRTKFELVDSLSKKDGLAFLNYDNPYIRGREVDKRLIRYGIEGENLDYWAEDIQVDIKGSTFTLCKSSGEKQVLQTKLLGIHNILNIVATVAVAAELGVDFEAIHYAVKTIEPVPHRLELKTTANGRTIIDDAFNSNPQGARMALQVLKIFQSQKKILITPGMVELGSKEYDYNKEFGMQAADVCDFIILVGPKRTVPIQEGLKMKNYPQERLFVMGSLSEALQKMHAIAGDGSVVLFENDLPDTYNE
jgi:UDP-N-acetylmuramoyl-tripeptide--D-alanyl-D-alanine ligase